MAAINIAVSPLMQVINSGVTAPNPCGRSAWYESKPRLPPRFPSTAQHPGTQLLPSRVVSSHDGLRRLCGRCAGDILHGQSAHQESTRPSILSQAPSTSLLDSGKGHPVINMWFCQRPGVPAACIRALVGQRSASAGVSIADFQGGFRVPPVAPRTLAPLGALAPAVPVSRQPAGKPARKPAGTPA